MKKQYKTPEETRKRALAYYYVHRDERLEYQRRKKSAHRRSSLAYYYRHREERIKYQKEYNKRRKKPTEQVGVYDPFIINEGGKYEKIKSVGTR